MDHELRFRVVYLDGNRDELHAVQHCSINLVKLFMKGLRLQAVMMQLEALSKSSNDKIFADYAHMIKRLRQMSLPNTNAKKNGRKANKNDKTQNQNKTYGVPDSSVTPSNSKPRTEQSRGADQAKRDEKIRNRRAGRGRAPSPPATSASSESSKSRDPKTKASPSNKISRPSRSAVHIADIVDDEVSRRRIQAATAILTQPGEPVSESTWSRSRRVADKAQRDLHVPAPTPAQDYASVKPTLSYVIHDSIIRDGVSLSPDIEVVVRTSDGPVTLLGSTDFAAFYPAVRLILKKLRVSRVLSAEWLSRLLDSNQVFYDEDWIEEALGIPPARMFELLLNEHFLHPGGVLPAFLNRYAFTYSVHGAGKTVRVQTSSGLIDGVTLPSRYDLKFRSRTGARITLHDVYSEFKSGDYSFDELVSLGFLSSQVTGIFMMTEAPFFLESVRMATLQLPLKSWNTPAVIVGLKASGKSTVVSHLQKRGMTVLDSDELGEMYPLRCPDDEEFPGMTVEQVANACDGDAVRFDIWHRTKYLKFLASINHELTQSVIFVHTSAEQYSLPGRNNYILRSPIDNIQGIIFRESHADKTLDLWLYEFYASRINRHGTVVSIRDLVGA